jgi:RNA polymerase sigma-70 factor (ECF subfamily)
VTGQQVTDTEDRRWTDFEAFYRVQFDNVAGAVFLMLGDREEAFDVTQEAFTRTWVAWAQIQEHERPEAFPFRVAMNLAKSHLRRLATFRRLLPRAVEGRADAIPDARADDRLVLAEALRELPPRQRSAVILCDLAGFTSEEAARLLRSRASTVRVHLARARSTLRSVLMEHQPGPEPEPQAHRARANPRNQGTG